MEWRDSRRGGQIVLATIAFCIVRALPVFWEGLRGFRTEERLRHERHRGAASRRSAVDVMNVPANQRGRIAAVFDIDGTLIPAPSLEMRLLADLVLAKELRLRAIFAWLRRYFCKC